MFQLTPVGEFNRFEIFDVTMNNTDFEPALENATTSIEDRLLAVGQQIGLERGEPDPIRFADSLFVNINADRDRATRMQFRGKPQDVKFLESEGVRKAYVPLGGDISFPGNEVAVVDIENGDLIRRIEVGIRPTRVFADQLNELVFVCNEYSNYISIIDARIDDLLENRDGPVTIPTDFYCRDVIAVERNIGRGEGDELYVLVANEFRSSLMRYSVDIIENGLGDVDDIALNPPPNQPDNVPEAEIGGVGKNPYRLVLNDAQNQVYVTNSRGGEVALVDIRSGNVLGYNVYLGATQDIVPIVDKVYIATTTIQRGYLEQRQVPDDVDEGELRLPGLNNVTDTAHLGAQFDETASYNFEDARNTIMQLDLDLGQNIPDEIVDIVEVDAFYDEDQKQLAGALPWDLEKVGNNELFAAMLGSDIVQKFDVVNGAGTRLINSGLIFETAELPSAIAADVDGGVLLVASMGGDFLEIFDIDNAALLAQVDLGYADPRYPASTMEAGEYFYTTARWSSDGQKSCVTCHVDRLQVDGIPYGNGATSPTMPHQVKPNWNLMETENYFWNGTFVNNSYASLAFAAQSRTNCELITFALVEGPASDPADRVGDVNAFSSNDGAIAAGVGVAADDDDINCQPTFDPAIRDPLPSRVGGLSEDVLATMPGPLNGVDLDGDGLSTFLDIAVVINNQKQRRTFPGTALAVQDQLLRAGLDTVLADPVAGRDDVSRAMDYYGVAWLRLPPNPISQLREMGMLASSDLAKLSLGEDIFINEAKCSGCHNPVNSQAPFADNADHGAGGEWIADFIQTYGNDPTFLDVVPDGIPQQMLDSASREFSTQEINVHQLELDFFSPFCFDDENCLRFEDPKAQRGTAEEEERLFRVSLVNIADPDRGFVPGQVIGQARVNTPSLRGVWLQHNLLRHGQARSFREAILAPGHEALVDGEVGFAIDRGRNTNVHGETRDLSPDEIEALEFYLRAIE
ncbi:MAG: hypothetical protein Tsb0020_01930 [Haliangiales bacterium]